MAYSSSVIDHDMSKVASEGDCVVAISSQF